MTRSDAAEDAMSGRFDAVVFFWDALKKRTVQFLNGPHLPEPAEEPQGYLRVIRSRGAASLAIDAASA